MNKVGFDYRLRSAQGRDFDFLAALRRDPAMQSQLMSIPASTEDTAIRQWIERRNDDPNGAFRVIVTQYANKPLGFVQIFQIHRRNATGHGGLALAPTVQGRGIGRTAMELLFDLAANELRLRKLLAEIRADNQASLRLHFSMGYREVGRLERHFRDGEDRLHDVVLAERILPETTA